MFQEVPQNFGEIAKNMVLLGYMTFLMVMDMFILMQNVYSIGKSSIK